MTPKANTALETPTAPESAGRAASVDVHLSDAEAAATLAREALAADGLSEELDVTADGVENDRGEADCPPAEGLSTIAVHGGEARQKMANAITDPIFAASTYTFENSQAVIDFIEQKQPREEYGRYGNPSERVVERKLAALEGGESALLFSTGMSALVGLLMAKLNSGDEVIFFDECYHRSREFCSKHLSRFGVVTRQVRACDYDAMEAAITPRTRLLISESPTNPHLSIVDLERFADLGHRHGVETLIDATLGTPFNIRPLAAGIDYVMHSATKYLGGHNDLLAGVVIGTAEKLEPVRKLRGIMGTINSPQNIYLLGRGLKTFELRMRRHNENGMAVAQFLATHPRIEKVYYPGLPSHPYHEIAKRTMRGFGGLVTFLVRGADWRETARVVDSVRIPRIAPSLGGVESLIEQPLVMSYYECTPADRQRFGILDNMIRLACGIENPEDLVADLQQALER
jgi:cystathionine gamma-synthase